MFRTFGFGKILAAATLVGGMLLAAAPAEARFHGGGARPARAFHAPARFAPRPIYRPVYRQRVYRPRFVRAPIYQPYPVYGYRCVIKKRWALGPFGPVLIRKRVCY
jgi:hypothetical protein